MAAVPCVLERQAANDEAAIVVAIHAADGDRVKEGDPVVDVETSKAAEEGGAPQGGSGAELDDGPEGRQDGYGDADPAFAEHRVIGVEKPGHAERPRLRRARHTPSSRSRR